MLTFRCGEPVVDVRCCCGVVRRDDVVATVAGNSSIRRADGSVPGARRRRDRVRLSQGHRSLQDRCASLAASPPPACCRRAASNVRKRTGNVAETLRDARKKRASAYSDYFQNQKYGQHIRVPHRLSNRTFQYEFIGLSINNLS